MLSRFLEPYWRREWVRRPTKREKSERRVGALSRIVGISWREDLLSDKEVSVD